MVSWYCRLACGARTVDRVRESTLEARLGLVESWLECLTVRASHISSVLKGMSLIALCLDELILITR